MTHNIDFNRDIEKLFDRWFEGTYRKPLIVRGARQIGKSYAIRSWCKRVAGIGSYAEVNFEEMPQLKGLFATDLNIHRIVEELSLYTNVDLFDPSSILFLDEIQSVPQAIVALRFFRENMPELPVIAAGSLLEFVLDEISIPVGRVEYLEMYPLTFYEFLTALKKEKLRGYLERRSMDSPIEKIHHQELLEYTKKYFRVGGMPEAVQVYAETGSLKQVAQVHRSLFETYRDDFAKYAKKSEWAALQILFEQSPSLVGRSKIVYSHITSDIRADRLKSALQLLSYARVLTKAYQTQALLPPLISTVKFDRFKVIFVDIGLMQYGLGFDWSAVSPDDDLTNIHEGALAEQFVGQELLAASSERNLFYWHRETAGSEAEVDYVVVSQGRSAPVEVKSGAKGSLKSLHKFVEEKKPAKAFVLSEKNISKTMIEDTELTWLPLYCAARLSYGRLVDSEIEVPDR